MRVVATVESRMTSRRLPGKNLMPILGEPMLYRLLERLTRSQRLAAICLATSTDPSDKVLTEVADRLKLNWYRGSLNDVLTRVLEAAKSVKADVIAEITGDCPLIDPNIVDAVIDRYSGGGYDYVANMLDGLTFPIGFDVQVFSVPLLDEISRLVSDGRDRENVSSFIYRHPERYRLLSLRAPAGLHRARYRLCVDYIHDFEVIAEIYKSLYPRNSAFDAWDIIEFLDNRPDLITKNNWMDDAFVWPSSQGHAAEETLLLPGGSQARA
jgi:spore coat polysaccharide biosynthesis protein SpsF